MSDIKSAMEAVLGEIADLSDANEFLQEELQSVRAMMARDEEGWTPLGSVGGDSTGLSLKTLKDISKQAREMAVGNPLIDRAIGLRLSYVWSKGVTIPDVESPKESRRGPRTVLDKFFKDPINQKNVFGDAAHEIMETAAATDGAFFLIGDESTKQLRPIQISEVAAIHVNPDFPDEVWAILREWTPDPTGTKTKKRWYYSDTFTGKRKSSIPDDTGTSQPVAQGETVLDIWFNRQAGWALGVPDAAAAIVWARIYSELIHNGRIMTEALARYVAQVKARSQKGAKSIGVKTSTGGVGQTAVTGEGNELSVFQSAGKTYDFNGVRPVAALVATAMEVSIVHLLSDPGAAGSSYGSASNLDLPTKRAMVSRQNVWARYLERVFRWGAGTDVEVTFPNLDDPDPYREMQIAALAWNSGLFHPDEVRKRMTNIANVVTTEDSAPEGVLLPNNSESWERSDIDPSDDPDAVATSTGSPDQGRSNGGGGTDSTLANDLQEMRIASLLDRMEALVGQTIAEE